jgi:hypothetical protein
MNAVSKKALLVLATSGALVLCAFARSPGIAGSRGPVRSGSVSPPVIIPGAGTTGPTMPGTTIPGQGSGVTPPGTNLPSVGLPGQHVPGIMSPVPSVPSLIGK